MKIAIVNHQPQAVEILRRALLLEPRHSLAWVARDGAEAVELCAAMPPDLVLMELGLPRIDGVEATRRIMVATPCPILVVTSSVGASTAKVYEAMGHGALDAVDTPLTAADERAAAAPLLAKISTIARLVGDRGALPPRSSAAAPAPGTSLVAIGSSAGGPAALAELLAGLPATFPAAVVIVQHVDRQFAAGMAEWLGRSSALPVRLAEEGGRPIPGTVLLAGTNDHLCFKAPGRLGYTAEPAEEVYRPSVDVFFHSMCRHWGGRAVGVLLTGMGRDGAAGLKALRDRGFHTIAQDQASSAVFGMPKAAIALGAACEVQPLSRIAAAVCVRVGVTAERGAAEAVSGNLAQ